MRQSLKAARVRAAGVDLRDTRPVALAKAGKLRTSSKLESLLKVTRQEFGHGRYRLKLYRFLSDNLPLVGACIHTWSRLTAAPGEFEILANGSNSAAKARLDELSRRISDNGSGQPRTMTSFLIELCNALFRDGQFGGFLTVNSDGSGVDRFVPIDTINLGFDEHASSRRLVLDTGEKSLRLDRPDFYHLTMGDSLVAPMGKSVLASIPFVAYIEQQLVDDMRRANHNSGYHRLHVKIAPPERLAGESDKLYVERINSYFDSTVRMIRDCDVDDNPVTWDNVDIAYVGPEGNRSISNNWFMNHRAMVEEICAGTNLAPFLLGYSYGETTTWAKFKFDLVMRQVQSVQAEIADFLSWIGNIELALAGYNHTCRYRFDNHMSYQADGEAEIESRQVDSLLKLHQSGLVDEETARSRAEELI